MPHLTTPTVTRPAGDTAGGLRFGAPGYGHPMLAPLEWDELSRPGTPLRWAVLNVRHGPGERPDGYCREAVSRVRSAGRRMLGRLECHRGFRPFRELLSDAHRFLEWYGVDGFYLARCPGEPACLGETRRVVTTLRALCPGGLLVLGHGRSPYHGYAECADQLVTFAGRWADYRWSQAADWTAELPPERFCHLVHSVPRTHLEEALRIARWQGAGTVWFTDRTNRAGANPWEGLPGFWEEIVSHIGRGLGE